MKHPLSVRRAAALLLLLLAGSLPPVLASEGTVLAKPGVKKVYLASCFACHMATGEGLPNVFPPLAKSDYLKADKDRAIKVVLKGMSGPITVNGSAYNNMMPPQEVTDDQAADVLTYVMNSWGNDFGNVSASDVRRVRAETR